MQRRRRKEKEVFTISQNVQTSEGTADPDIHQRRVRITLISSSLTFTLQTQKQISTDQQ